MHTIISYIGFCFGWFFFSGYTSSREIVFSVFCFIVILYGTYKDGNKMQ